MTKKCRKCHKYKNIDDFPLFSTDKSGRKNTCYSCSAQLNRLRSKLKKQNAPPIAGLCPICNQHTTSWVLDHCHFNNNFRGYICNSCNLGLGRFNDNIDLLYKAINYLQSDVWNIEYHI